MKYFLAIILLLFVSSCNNYGQESLKNPLTAYRKGHYRKVIDDFEKNPKKIKTPELSYILASSYLELKNYQKAFETFHAIDGFQLAKDPKYSYIFPFYIRKYIYVLLELGDSDILSEQEEDDILQLIALVPKNSPIRKYLDKEIFDILWMQKKYTTMRLLNKNLSTVGKAWIELANHALKLPYTITPILKSYQSFLSTPIYSNMIRDIDPHHIHKAQEAKILAQMSLYVPEQRDRALEFAKQYEKLSHDTEYPIIIKSSILSMNGQETEAAQLMYEHINIKPTVCLAFYTNTYDQLIKKKLFTEANQIALLAEKYHRQKFTHVMPNPIEFSEDPDYVFSWYKTHYKDISADLHEQAIRVLIRYDMKKAELAIDLGISENMNNPSFILMHGLIKESLGKTEEAYKSYLRLIFQDAFGYSGIVARKKEKKLRMQYHQLFQQSIMNIISSMKKFRLEDRLMIAKVLLLDEETKALVNKKQLKRDQRKFDKIVYGDLNKIDKIFSLENYNQKLSNLAPETQDYIENAVNKKIKNSDDFHKKAKYYFKYKNIFLNSDIEGYLTFQLYFYVRDQFGRKYLPNYPKEIVHLIFPKPEFSLIKKLSDHNENLAYWMLSSFLVESHFRKRVYSQVGAVGFAQVMPYTAKDIKRWMKKPYLSNYDFYDNLAMGVYYHKKMYQMMDSNIILSLAAYNAGPNAVRRWKKNYHHIKDDYLFVEALLYKETRNYVKLIIYNRGMYDILNKHPEILFD